MPMMPARTDRVTLNGLLTSGKLTSSEKAAFQQMFDDLAQGRIIGLSPKQRLWANSVWQKYKVGDMVYAGRKQARVMVRAEEASALDKMPKPLKPPARAKV